MQNYYTEEALIEQPAIEIFKQLGYEHQNCYYETFGDNSSLGRETSSDVILISKLKPALQKLNPNIPTEGIDSAIEKIKKDRSILNPVTANKEIYKLLKDGINVSFKNNKDEEIEDVVRVIDFQNPESNDFFIASQFWITGDLYKRRADIIGFVNGIPLMFIELKGIHKKVEDAFHGNLQDYRDTIPQLFLYNAFIILSNGSESVIGTITSDFGHFNEWKRISSETEKGVVSLDTIIKGVCDKSRLLDLLENFILFQNTGGTLIKVVSKNHQYLGVNNAIEKFKKVKDNEGKLGVFWHTQGSGKSFSMIFFSQKILRKFDGNYTFVIVTDRRELDKQIYKNFVNCGAVTESEVHAESRAHLKELLKENHRNIFTLIHKFGTSAGEDIEVLSDRKDIIVITDESHRSQYDTLALNMRAALPNASFIAFTGTPLMTGEEKTKDTFGDYISIYDFNQSIEDKATVPLYYENRIPELQLEEKELFNDKIQEIIENAELSEDEELKLEKEFSKEYHLIVRDDRLEKIAKDIVEHFVNRGFKGKGMVICIDKPTAVRMYDKVKKIWKEKIEEVKEKYKASQAIYSIDVSELAEKIKYMEETDMAVIVSQEQNEISKFKKLGLDIETHRRRMVNEDMEEKFKNPDEPFRLVFVCAMWMTGFDAPSVSTIYLDKPMKNHTLMQTIARANRVFKEKSSGLIIDYIGIFRNLKKALAIYGSGVRTEAEGPVRSKEELIDELRKKLQELTYFCLQKEIDIGKILEADELHVIQLIDDSVDKLLINDETKKNFLSAVNSINLIYKAILPDKSANEFHKKIRLINSIASKIRVLEGTPDISGIMNQIGELLDDSVKAEAYQIKESNQVDLSKIDVDKLKKIFEKGKKNTEAEKLKNALRNKVHQMIVLNKSRTDFAEKLEELIIEYNSGSINVETFYKELIKFTKELKQEDERAIKEQLTEEELAIYDLLKKPKLNEKETAKVKLAAKELLKSLKAGKLVIDWRKRQQTRANVRKAIEESLDNNLPKPPAYDETIFNQKCDLVYEHIYENYWGDGKSVYHDFQFFKT